MKKLLGSIGLIVILALGLLQASSPLLALAYPAAQASSGGLGVTNAIINLAATPGQVYTHSMVVSSGAGAQPMDIQVGTMGFGESLNGEFVPLSADSDTSPYSARTFITNISKTSFHLDPGAQVEVDATLTMPQNLGSDTRYAIIYIHSAAVSANGQNGVGQILAVSVPVIITPANATLNQTGVISDVKIDPVQAGNPITIQTTVKNTGNRHFKIKGTADISDANGKAVTQLTFPITSTSIFPTFSRLVTFTYSSLDHPEGLQPGKYGVDIKILHEDGSLVDEKQASFEVTQPYTPFAGVDPSSVSIFNFNNQVPGTIDALAKADLQIEFENTGPVTGSVAVVKYPQEPALKPGFEDDAGNGGMGGVPLKFIGIRTVGFNQGTAHLLVHYNTNELTNNLDANSLFLANFLGNAWNKLNNLEVQSGTQLVTGDIGVSDLDNGVTITLGGQPAGSSQQSAPSIDTGTLILYIGVGLVGLLLIILLVYLLAFRNRPARSKK